MPADFRSILRLEVPLIVRLGAETMRIGDVLSLTPGAIIELSKPAEDDLDLMINNKQIGSGTAVKIGENFGIRISRIGNVRERLAAAASQTEVRAPESDADALAEAMLAGQC